MLWGKRLWDAKVLRRDGDFHFITYPGWPSVWDEWVLSDRIRPPGLTAKQARERARRRDKRNTVFPCQADHDGLDNRFIDRLIGVPGDGHVPPIARPGIRRLHVIDLAAHRLIGDLEEPVRQALHRGDSSCVERPVDGLWKSKDGRVLVEHGHLLPYDPNGYRNWPDITRKIDGVVYLEQPWGEHFVQRLFTQEERSYPLIDNLSPHSAGLRYRLRDRGLKRWNAAGKKPARLRLTTWKESAIPLDKLAGGVLEVDLEHDALQLLRVRLDESVTAPATGHVGCIQQEQQAVRPFGLWHLGPVSRLGKDQRCA